MAAETTGAHAASLASSPPPSTVAAAPHGPERSALSLLKPPRRASARRQRKKPCHIAQKERKASLVQELSGLEARVAELRRQVGAPSAEEVQLTQARALDNLQLQSALNTQHMLLASMQGCFSSYTNRMYQSPISTPVHLPADWERRRQVLMGMRDHKIRAAHQFLIERTSMMDMFQDTCEETRFRSPEGDYCSVRLDNTVFTDVSSVDEVQQAFRSFFQQADVVMSVASDSITTREGEEVAAEGISSHRFCTTTAGLGIQVEKNTVGFTGQVSTDCDGTDSIIMAMDNIDQDDAYPYRPHDRVRCDLSGAVRFRAHQAPQEEQQSDHGQVADAKSSTVVVLTRWYHIRTHRSLLSLPENGMEQVQTLMLRALDHMLHEIKCQLQLNRQRP